MTSLAGSTILVIIAFAVLVFMVMKGMNLLPAAIISSMILAFGVAGEGGAVNWVTNVFTTFASGAGSYATSLIVPFMVGGAFGAVMIASGSDIVIGRTIINKFGPNFAIYSLAVFVALMGFAGINSWPFLAAIMAFSLMRACDLPLQVACVTMVGINSAFSFIFPGSPTMPNILASQAFGTTMYAGASIGIVMCIVQCVLVMLYVKAGLVRKYKKQGIGYAETPMEANMRGQFHELPEEEMPSFFIAILPMIIVVAGCCILQLGLGFDSSSATVISQIVAIVVCTLTGLKKGMFRKLPGAISNGCVQTSWPMLATCAIVGFGSLMSSTTFYAAVMNWATNLHMSPYVMVVVGTAVVTAIGADPMSGIALSMQSFGQAAIAAGAKAGLVHRLTLAASTTFDSMPHSGNLNVTMGFLGLTHKDVYKDIVVVQIGATSAATIVGMIIAMIIG